MNLFSKILGRINSLNHNNAENQQKTTDMRMRSHHGRPSKEV